MRTLIVSDIHSNIVALDAVLRDANARGSVDNIWSLGDMVGYGPRPNECLDTLRGFEHTAVAGNHDLGAIGAIYLGMFNEEAAEACEWTAGQLTADNREYLEALPRVVKDGDYTLVHASLRDPIWEYLVHEEAARGSFDLLETQFLLVGHSHLTLLFEEIRPAPDAPPRVHAVGRLNHGALIHLPQDMRLILNPGSVGQPRDSDPRAAYAILDTDAWTYSQFRVAYDIEAVQTDMTDAGLPHSLVERLAYGL